MYSCDSRTPNGLTVFRGMFVVRGRVGTAPDLLKENKRPRLGVTPKTPRKMYICTEKEKDERAEESFPIDANSVLDRRDFLRGRASLLRIPRFHAATFIYGLIPRGNFFFNLLLNRK